MGKKIEISTFRGLVGWQRKLSRALLVIAPLLGIFFILEIPSYLGASILLEQYFGLFLGLVLCCVFLVVPATASSDMKRAPWYDMVLSALGFGIGVYIFLLYPDILSTMGIISPERYLISVALIILVLEGLRRMTGWILPIIGLIFICYARFAWLAPGIFNGPGIPWSKLSVYLVLDTNALFGTAMAVSAVIVLVFILFGNLLFGVGGGDFLSDLAMVLFGRFRGGPAKMAIVASSFFGSLSGSAVANVATTGVVTIPLMKKTGFKAEMAGAVEAVASTGGTLTPPIMGAAAFVISEFTGIPYYRVALASLIPALLYYAAVFVQVDLESGKAGFSGISKDQLPSIRGILRNCYLFIIPLATLIYALFVLIMPAGKAALVGALSILVLSMVRRETRFQMGWLLRGVEKTGRNLLELTLIVSMAGFIIGVVQVSGLGFIFPMVMSQAAGTNGFLMLLIVALACVILGMGMPTVAVYVLLGVLMAPAMVALGYPLLASHLFIQYFGTLSMFTPPICLAVFAAASIAEARSIRTAFFAMRLGILAYIVPFLFMYSPALLLEGPPLSVALAVLTAFAGVFFIGCSMVGYFFRFLGVFTRLAFFLSGISLLVPASGELFVLGLYTDIGGAFLGLILLIRELRIRARDRQMLPLSSV